MVKVTKVSEPMYSLELTERQAMVLRGILGKLTGATEDNLAEVYSALTGAGVESIQPKADIFTAIRRGT